MNVVVVGAGAIGMLVASFIAESSYKVTVISKREEQANLLKANGIVRKNLNQTIRINEVEVMTELSNISKDSVIIVAVKYAQLKDLYASISTLPDVPLLFIQNGLAHYEEALTLPQKTIFFCSCQFGAQKLNDYTVAHRGKGSMKLAFERGNHEAFDFLQQLQLDLLPIQIEENAEYMLFHKALLNCFINPLTAILKVKNGQLLESSHTFNIVESMYNEIILAFPEVKGTLSLEDVLDLCRKTSTNTSSMLTDFLQHRPTEMDTIVGAVIERASRRGSNLPTLSTLYHLLKVLEKSGEKM
ncbi:2-dehydropantoate 2-reductase [Lysinibacillus composti]|uniref:2-dehydropantoate 2-reductase n=1 Tax=Lysinibacillus composti TaxID=720633 RepID=A0A3N9UG00_9BACI|nr:2-dehydropantoate 2-reductase [Lysinibacillus composti]MBM7608259.1 2-dehydropantoate 2-reductase [Lysinibacillus composti]RQW75057.1 2-dehydropantoate 2-reductase [Lysinibacillus composti]